MKKDYGFLSAFLAVTALVFFAGNLALVRTADKQRDNFHKVEINRILDSGAENFSAADYKCIKSVEILGENADESAKDEFFRDENGEYTFVRRDGRLYRFGYVGLNRRPAAPFWIFNLCTAVIALAALLTGIYVYRMILTPFNRIKELPLELSKGNLAGAIPENRSRFFGRFVWGLNILRENIEEHKRGELELMKQKKTLILSISHDLKTPLSAIKLYAKALEKGIYTDEKRAEAIRNIGLRADEINDSINRIIKSSSEDLLDLEVREGEFYLSDLVGRIRNYYGEKLAFARIGFKIGKFDDAIISGDIDRCVEAVENLMENAIKYGDGREIELIFSREDDFRLLTVRNTGCTLADGELTHIFDSFWRGSNSANVGGSGLGLHICRTLMRKMGGDVYAQKENGDFLVTMVMKTA